MPTSSLATLGATLQFLKATSIAVVFVATYFYWRWLPQPHAF
jgi:hypothetical protein